MCSFDLVYQAITSMGLKTIGLSLPHETEAIAWQHQLRRKVGGEIIPATMSNLKHVIRRLQAGEIVVTGIDRPMDDLKYYPRFFDLPAHLPVHYVQWLGCKGAVLLMASFRQPDGRFELSSSELSFSTIRQTGKPSCWKMRRWSWNLQKK
jgi:lauroyl/myristoyl acyltransferase